MSLSITALHVGTSRNYPTPAITYFHGWGEVHDVPMIMFVIQGGADGPIVVDTGTANPASVLRFHSVVLERPDEQHPRAALERLGIDPTEVRTVVNTHLHWDHSSNNDLFPNARIYAQREEMAYAIAPYDTSRKGYENSRDATPPWLSSLGRMVPVDGEETIAPGVTLVPLPGHTPGSQGVLVEAGAKRFLIAGDFVDNYGNLAGDEQNAHFLSGSFVSLPDYWKSFKRLRELDCVVVPSHDPAVIGIGVFDEDYVAP